MQRLTKALSGGWENGEFCTSNSGVRKWIAVSQRWNPAHETDKESIMGLDAERSQAGMELMEFNQRSTRAQETCSLGVLLLLEYHFSSHPAGPLVSPNPRAFLQTRAPSSTRRTCSSSAMRPTCSCFLCGRRPRTGNSYLVRCIHTHTSAFHSATDPQQHKSILCTLIRQNPLYGGKSQ